MMSDVSHLVVQAVEIIARSEAKARGLKRFFTGRPCRRGHVAERLASDGNCVVCDRVNERAWIERNRDRERERLRAYELAKSRAMPAWADRAAIADVYAEAARLEAASGVPHHVDHAVPLKAMCRDAGRRGGQIACGLHVPWNLSPLPGCENASKSCYVDRDQLDAEQLEVSRRCAAEWAASSR
jgi:hypothetical protein